MIGDVVQGSVAGTGKFCIDRTSMFNEHLYICDKDRLAVCDKFLVNFQNDLSPITSLVGWFLKLKCCVIHYARYITHVNTGNRD